MACGLWMHCAAEGSGCCIPTYGQVTTPGQLYFGGNPRSRAVNVLKQFDQLLGNRGGSKKLWTRITDPCDASLSVIACLVLRLKLVGCQSWSPGPFLICLIFGHPL
eukprot:2538378-Amphidinium_carterae.2